MNSAWGVMLPGESTTPPITTRDAARDRLPGCRRSRRARLVRGPIATRVICPGWLVSCPARKSTALCGAGWDVGSGRRRVMPLVPWKCWALANLPTRGRLLPRNTGTSDRPTKSSRARALQRPRAWGTLPPATVSPTTSTEGADKAIRIAMASSTPGSVSIIIRRILEY